MIEKEIAIAFAFVLGAMIGAAIASYAYEKKIKNKEEEQKAKCYQISSDI